MRSRKDRPKVLPKVPERARTRRSCVGSARRKVIELPIVARNRGTTTRAVEGFEERRQQRKRQKEGVQRQVLQVWQYGSHVEGLHRVHSKQAKKAWLRLGCIEKASIDLNALEIGVVQLLENDHKIRIRSDSCAAVNVFPKTVADDYPMLQTPGKAESYRPASGKLLPDLRARKVQKDGSLRYVNPGVADTRRALMAVSERNGVGHDVCFPRSDRGISSCSKLELERVNGVFELPVELVPYGQSTSKNSTSGPYSSLSVMEQIEAMMVRIVIADHPNCKERAVQ